MSIEIVKASALDIAFNRIKISHEDNKYLMQYLQRSLFAWTGLVDGQVACMWGIIAPTALSTRGYLWLFTTKLVDQHKFLFVRHSQLVIEEMLKIFPKITGTVVATQTRSILWLKWLGVEFRTEEDGMIHFELRHD